MLISSLNCAELFAKLFAKLQLHCLDLLMHFAVNSGFLLAPVSLHCTLLWNAMWAHWFLWTLDTLHIEQWTLLWNNVSKMVLVDTEERGWDGLLRSRWTSSTKHCKWNHGTRWTFLKIQIFKGLFWSNFHGAWPIMELGAIFVVTDSRFTESAILGVG